MNKLQLSFAMLLGSSSLAPAMATAADQLQGVSWSLVAIQSMDDSVLKPGADEHYQLEFGDDGSVRVQVDCNRGTANYESAGPGQLRFGPIATTRMSCGNDSIDGVFLSNLDAVRSYVFREGGLYLATMMDGSILEFQPEAGGETATGPAFDCNKANAKVEEAICDSAELAALDVELNKVYQKALHSFPDEELASLKAYQRGWIKGRNECWKQEDPKQCVGNEYRSRITDLQLKTGSVMVPSPTLYDCDDGEVLSVYYYADTKVPAAVLNKGTEQVITHETAADMGKLYQAANVMLEQGEQQVALSWLDKTSICMLNK